MRYYSYSKPLVSRIARSCIPGICRSLGDRWVVRYETICRSTRKECNVVVVVVAFNLKTVPVSSLSTTIGNFEEQVLKAIKSFNETLYYSVAAG